MNTGRSKSLFGGTVVLLATVIWLFVTADSSSDQDLFFGQWRVGSFLVGLGGLWVAFSFFLASFSREWLMGWIAAAGVFAIPVLFFELIGQVGLVDYEALFLPRHTALGTVAKPNMSVDGVTPEDIATGWSLPSEQFDFHYQTDRRGYRNAHDRDGADVYLLGDSILVAAAVAFEDTVTGRLASALNASTANIALIGVSVQKERDMLKDADVPLANRLVLHFIFEGNDITDSAQYRSEQQADDEGAESRSGAGTFRSRSLLNRLLVAGQRLTDGRKYRPSRLIGQFQGRDMLFGWDRKSFEAFDEEWPYVTEAIQDTRDYVRAEGGQYVLVFVPAKVRAVGPYCDWPNGSDEYRAHLNPMRHQLLKWSAEHEIPLIDLTVALQKVAASGTSPWFYGDTHPNTVGHQAMAATIAAAPAVAKWVTRRAPKSDGSADQ